MAMNIVNNIDNLVGVRHMLVSVSDKLGLIPFVSALSKLGVEILSTGGTCRAIREAGVEVTEVSEKTGFPEIMDGRVKTLHPVIHGGLLGRRGRQPGGQEQTRARAQPPPDRQMASQLQEVSELVCAKRAIAPPRVVRPAVEIAEQQAESRPRRLPHLQHASRGVRRHEPRGGTDAPDPRRARSLLTT